MLWTGRVALLLLNSFNMSWSKSATKSQGRPGPPRTLGIGRLLAAEGSLADTAQKRAGLRSSIHIVATLLGEPLRLHEITFVRVSASNLCRDHWESQSKSLRTCRMQNW